MRSDFRARTKSIAVCLATSMRLAGAKSSDSMLLERSIASTIEIPSLRAWARADPTRGPAAATIQAPRHRLRSVTGSRATHRRSLTPAAGPAGEHGPTTTAAARRAQVIATAGRSSRRDLLREAARHLREPRQVGPVGRSEGDAVELLEQGTQLA